MENSLFFFKKSDQFISRKQKKLESLAFNEYFCGIESFIKTVLIWAYKLILTNIWIIPKKINQISAFGYFILIIWPKVETSEIPKDRIQVHAVFIFIYIVIAVSFIYYL